VVDPTQLIGWERILQSQVAIALLLVSGYPVLFLVIRRLYADKEAAQQLIREHLATQTAFDGTVKRVETLLHLVRTDETLRPADDRRAPAPPLAEPAGAAGHGAAGAGAPAEAD
jgi:hypothetical protein